MDSARTPEAITRKKWWVAGKDSWFTAAVKARCGKITHAPTPAPTPMCRFVVLSGLSRFAPRYNCMGEYQKDGTMRYIRRFSYGLSFVLSKYNGTWRLATSLANSTFLQVIDTAESPTEITGTWSYRNTKNPKHFRPAISVHCPTPAPTLAPTQTPTPSTGCSCTSTHS